MAEPRISIFGEIEFFADSELFWCNLTPHQFLELETSHFPRFYPLPLRKIPKFIWQNNVSWDTRPPFQRSSAVDLAKQRMSDIRCFAKSTVHTQQYGGNYDNWGLSVI